MTVRTVNRPGSPIQDNGRRRRGLVPAAALAAAAAAAAATTARAATDYWVGTTAADWAGTNGFNVVPTSGDSLLFGTAGAAGTNLTDDLSSGFNVAGITFNSSASAYNISGAQFNLTGGITDSSAFNQSISDNIGLSAVQTFNTSTAGVGLTLAGNLTGAGGFNLAGSGTLVLSGSNSFTGNATVNNGTVLQLQNTTGAATSAALNSTSYGHLTLNGGSTVQLRSDVSTTFGGFTGLGGVGGATLTFDVNELTSAGTAGSTLTIGGFNTYNTTVVSTGGNGDVLGIGTLASVGGSLTLDATTANLTVAGISGSPSLTVDGTGTTTVTGTATAGGSIIKGGSGTLVLSGSNSIPGILLYEGVAEATSSNAFGTSSTISQASGTRSAGVEFLGSASGITIPVGVTFTVSNDGNSTLNMSGQPTVPFALDNQGGNTTILGPVDLTTGGGNSVIEADAGTVVGATPGVFTLTTIANTAGSARTSVFQGTGNGVVTGTISDGSGGSSPTSVTMQGTGTWALAGNSNYSGGTTITSGILQVGNGGSGGNLGASTGAVTDNATLAFNLSSGKAIANQITGSGAVVVAGSGTVTLSNANNNYSGSTNVSQGAALNVTGSLTGTSAVNVLGGALSGTGTVAGPVSISPGGAVDFTKDGLSTPTAVLTLQNGLTLNGSSGTAANLTFNIGMAGTDLINISGGSFTVTTAGTPDRVNLNAIGNQASGTYTLADYGSSNLPLGNLSSSSPLQVGSRPAGLYTFTLSNTGTALQVSETATPAPVTAYWTGRDDTVWGDYNASGPITNFASNATGATDAGQLPSTGTDVVFTAATKNGSSGTSLSGAAISTTLGASFSINSLTVNAIPASVSIGNLSSGNTLTLNAAASQAGGLGYAAGTGLVVASGAGPVTINATTLVPASSQSWTNNSASNLSIGSAVKGSAAAGTVTQLTLANTNGSASGGTTLSGAISDGPNGGSLAVVVANTGPGLTTLSGSNAYSGGTTLNGGTLVGGANSFGTGNVTVAPTVASTATLDSTNSVASTATVTLTGGSGLATANFFGTSPTVAALSGDANSVANFTGASPTVGLLSNSGTTVFNGATPTVAVLSSSGSTTFNGSTPSVGILNGSGGIALNGTTGTSLTIGSTTGTYANASFNFSGGISEGTAGMGSVTTVGSGTITFNGTSNTYTGTTNVSAGTLQLDDTGVALPGNVLVANGSFLTLLNNQQIASTAAVTVASNGHFELNGFNQTIGALATAVGGTNSLVEGTEGNAPVGNQTSTLIVNQSTNTIFDGIMRDNSQYGYGGVQGLLALAKGGTGTLNLTYTGGISGLGTGFSGGLTVNSGTVALIDNGSGSTVGLFASAVTLNGSGGSLALSDTKAGNTQTFSQAISGTGGVLIPGPGDTNVQTFTGSGANVGTIVLNTASSYSGTTTVDGGSLRVTASGATGNGPVVVNTGATLGGSASITNATGAVVTVNAGGTITGGSSNTSTGTLTTGAQAWNSSTGTFLAKVTDITGDNDKLVMSSLTVVPGFAVTLASTGTEAAFTATNPSPTTGGTPVAGSYIVLATDTESAGTNPFASPATLAALNLTFTNNGVLPVSGSTDKVVLDTESDGGGFDLIAEDVAAPEPTSLLLAGGVVAPLVLGRRRRRGVGDGVA